VIAAAQRLGVAAFAGCLVAACARGDAPVTPLPAGTTVYAFRNHVDNVFGATLGAEGNLYLALYYPSAIALFAPERKTYRILWRPRSKVYDYSDYTADENNGVWIAEGNKYSDAAPAYLIHAHSDGKLTSFTFPPHSGYPFRLSTSSRDGAIWYLPSHDVLGSFDVQTHRFELQYGFFPESSFAAEGENIVFVGEQGIRVGRAIRPFRVDTTIPGSFGNANALRTASDTMWLGRFGALYHFRDSSKPQACSTTAVPIFTALTVMPKGQQVCFEEL